MHKVIIAGGGPAGVMSGLLLARAGVDVLVLEKHADFFRDFRGDTVHPSTMELLDDMGMLERFLERPHDKVRAAGLRLAGKHYEIADLSKLNSPAPFIAMMPQWEFLDFLRDEAVQYSGFNLEMEAEVEEFIERDRRIVGTRLTDGREFFASALVIAADGRGSLVREKAMMPMKRLGAPMDVLWFRLPKKANEGERLRGSIDTGRMVILIDRNDYWQTAMLIPKGTGAEIKARGVDYVKAQVAAAYPDLDFSGDGLGEQGPQSVDDLFVLSVALDRLEKWHRPGLLAIGDAAHAMSPIGGIGINLAIQDAAAMANALAVPLAADGLVDHLLEQVEKRRMLPTRIIQAGQKFAQDNFLSAVVGGGEITAAPLPVRLLNRWPFLRGIPAKMIGHGFRRETVQSPDVGQDVKAP